MYKPVPTRPDFPALERDVLDFWERTSAFDKLRQKNQHGPRWSFIDGPITANNPMGVHHAWGRTYKDIYQRYKAMLGHHQRYQNGFDCQGLWVEVEVERELGFNSKREIEAYGLQRFSEACKERVWKYAATQTQQSIRLGQWMDWDNSYYTMSDDNIEHIWHFLRVCHEKGWLYQGARAMPWCTRCGTGLSQHELVGTDSYRDVVHPSVYLQLPVTGRDNERFLVWTTTPWTLSANVALAVHPQLAYVKVRQGDDVLILSQRAVGALRGPHQVVETVKGADLVGLRYHGPFDEFEAQHEVDHRVVAWDEVGEQEGTGIVHIAPGCGAEDYELSRQHDLAVLVPINDFGDYVPGYGALSGRNVNQVKEQIYSSLTTRGLLYHLADYLHRYPTCWRCGEELVFRLSEEWFIGAEEIRPLAKAAAAQVRWVPPSVGKRMEDWLNNMGDWNISRRRYWGLPLPFYPCKACGGLTVVGSKAELDSLAMGNMEQLEELHRPWIDDVKIKCPQCGQVVDRIPEVGDAWLDAGIVPFSTLGYLADRSYWEQWYPADFITEMREQVRLWFYSMLFMSVTLRGIAPYKCVMAYEKLLDEQGRPMHKSLGNAIWFDEAAEKMGADVMRWLYASQNIQTNLLFGYSPAEEARRKLLTLWNTYNFFVTYASIDRFVPDLSPLRLRRGAGGEVRAPLDRWILSRLQDLIGRVRDSLDGYESAGATQAVERFVDDLSNWYVRRSRRRFWKSEADQDKRSAYQTLHEALTTLARLMAPITPFLSEAMYQNLVRSVDDQQPESVHHTAFPERNPALVDPELDAQMEMARQVVGLGRAARMQAGIKVRQPLPALEVAGVERPPEGLVGEVADELNVKQVRFVKDLGHRLRRQARPRPEVMGPRYGSQYPALLQALQAGQYQANPDGSVRVGGHTLSPDEVEIEHRAAPGWSVAQERQLGVALDLNVSPELRSEGWAREAVRLIQDLRRQADFKVDDRIQTIYRTDEELAAALQGHKDYLCRETLSVTLAHAAELDDAWHSWSGRLDGHALQLSVRRAT